MNGFNTVTLRGEFVNGPEMTETRNGFKLVEMNLAVAENAMKDGQWTTKEMIIPVTFFGDTAEDVCDNYHGGDLVIVTGKVRSTTAQTQNGRDYYRISISGTGIEQIYSPYNERNKGRTSARQQTAAQPQYQAQQYQPQQQAAPQGFQQQYSGQQQNQSDIPF